MAGKKNGHKQKSLLGRDLMLAAKLIIHLPSVALSNIGV